MSVEELVKRLRETHTCDGCGEYVGSQVTTLLDEAAIALEAKGAELAELKDAFIEQSKMLTISTKAGHEALTALASEFAAHAETKSRLAEVEKALEPFSDIADLIVNETEGMSETDELELYLYDYRMASWPVSMFHTVRRVLEGGKANA